MAHGTFPCPHCGEPFPFDWMANIHIRRCPKREVQTPPRMQTPEEELFEEFKALVVAGHAPGTDGQL